MIGAEKGSLLTLDLNTNAFRVLGLEMNAPLSAAIARRNELLAQISINSVPSYTSDYVIFAPPERTLETVAAAVQRLEDPRTRLLDEATWFHLRDSIDAFAASTLSDGNSPQARALWEGAVDQATDPVTRQHYQHNLAILHLCTAEIPAQSLRSPRKIWDRVLTAWTALLRSSTFWRQLADESPASRDTRFQPETPTEVRTSIGLKLAQECSRRSAEALAEGRTEDAWDWATAPTTNQLPAEFTAHAEEEVIEAAAEFIRTKLGPIQASLRDSEKRSVNVKRLEPNVLLARNTFEQFRLLGPKTNPALMTTADLVADTLRLLGIHYNNTIKDYAKALQITEDAFKFVASEGLRVILQQHMRIYQRNIAQAAFEAANEANDYKKALAAFEDLERYADPEKAPDGLDPFRHTLKDLLLKKELRKLRWENAVLVFEAAYEAHSYDEALVAFQRLEQEFDPTESPRALDPFRDGLKDLFRVRNLRIHRWDDACAAFKAAAEANDCVKALAAFEELEKYADPAKSPEALDAFRDNLNDLLRSRELRIRRWSEAWAAFEVAVKAKDYEAASAIYADLERYVDPAEGPKVLDPFRGALEDLRFAHDGKRTQRARRASYSAAQRPERGWVPSLPHAAAIAALLAVVFAGWILSRYFVPQTSTPSSTPPIAPRQPAKPQIPTTPLRGDEIPQKLSRPVKPLTPSPKVGSSAPGEPLPKIAPLQPSVDRSARRSEIERRRSDLEAEDAALEAEQVLISRERAALGGLHADIEARYEGYPNGLPPDVYSRYEVEVAEHKQRVQRFNARVQAYNARATASKRAVAEFNALVNQYNASR